jgi:hypothetical protein
MEGGGAGRLKGGDAGQKASSTCLTECKAACYEPLVGRNVPRHLQPLMLHASPRSMRSCHMGLGDKPGLGVCTAKF